MSPKTRARAIAKSRTWQGCILPVLILLLALALLFPACARRPVSPPPSPAPVTKPKPVPSATEIAEGKGLYTKSCVACHGPQGEGTAVGPKVTGHSTVAVKMQVRNPMGTMPAFTEAQLSNAALDKIAAFIASLEEPKTPVQEWEKAAPETMHHWMALLAIKNGDAADARHHLESALAFIKAPVHEVEMKKALDLIAQGKIHDAEHEIEEMAGSESPSGITMQRFHLVLARRGVEAESTAEVKHHLGDFLTAATEKQKVIARKAMELAEKGDFHEAEHEIEELLED